MNGILSGMPTGILDPRAAMMATIGSSLLASGGPSRTPVSFGQALGQAVPQGLNVFQQLQQAKIQEEMKKRQLAMQEEELLLQKEKANRPPAPIAGSPGTVFLDPVTRQPVFTVPHKPEAPKEPPKPMTRQVQMGSDVVTQEYINGEWKEIGRGPKFQPTKPPQQPKAPTGFRYRDGTDELEPIPGGPKDTSKKDQARLETARSRADIVIGKVDDALGKVGFFTTGLTGAVLGNIPGTDAYDLRQIATTIKANIGFQELQAMREASPTGGALGQVAVQELTALQSVLSSLDANQSPEELSKSLKAVRQHYENWKNAVAQAGSESGSPSPSPAPSPTPSPRQFPAPSAEAIRRLKMKPGERAQFEAVFGPGSAAKALGR